MAIKLISFSRFCLLLMIQARRERWPTDTWRCLRAAYRGSSLQEAWPARRSDHTNPKSPHSVSPQLERLLKHTAFMHQSTVLLIIKPVGLMGDAPSSLTQNIESDVSECSEDQISSWFEPLRETKQSQDGHESVQCSANHSDELSNASRLWSLHLHQDGCLKSTNPHNQERPHMHP